MLRPDEFYVGDLAKESSDQVALLWPRGSYEHMALIGRFHDQRYGIVLDGELPGQAYPINDDGGWRGLLIPRVTIEVDPRSAFDPSTAVEIGTLTREGVSLMIVGAAGPYPRVARPLKISLATKLPAGEDREGVGFRRWQIVIGAGADKRVLFSADAEQIAKARAATLAAN